MASRVSIIRFLLTQDLKRNPMLFSHTSIQVVQIRPVTVTTILPFQPRREFRLPISSLMPCTQLNSHPSLTIPLHMHPRVPPRIRLPTHLLLPLLILVPLNRSGNPIRLGRLLVNHRRCNTNPAATPRLLTAEHRGIVLFLKPRQPMPLRLNPTTVSR